MRLIGLILKKTLALTWDELYYLCLFNMLTLAAVMAGPVVFLLGLGVKNLLLAAIALPLTLAAPPAIFGLFWLTCQISQGKAVKMSTYFQGVRQFWKPAYVWGGINLLAGWALASNIFFYENLAVSWGGYLIIFFRGLTIFWLALQLLTLAFYPRLVAPGFRKAIKNALALLVLQPMPVLALVALSVGLGLVGGRVWPAMGLIIPSLIALLANVTLTVTLKHVPVKEDGFDNPA